MNAIRFLFVVSTLFVPGLVPGNEGPNLYLEATATKELVAKEGQKVIVYGHTENSAKSASGANFVNFKGAEFFLVTFQSDLAQFPGGEPFEQFDGKRVAVEGVISIYRDKPQIKLTRPDQVRILKEEEVFPPVAEKPAGGDATDTPEKSMEKPETPSEEKEEEPKRKPPVDASEFFD